MQPKRRGAARPTVRRVCFVTGSRAEFGLMQSVLKAIAATPTLRLQIIATGMHLDATHGKSIDEIQRQGWKIDAAIPWSPGNLAVATGTACAEMARRQLTKLKSDIVLVVGDRVEAFAGAMAGHLNGCAVAHVHGGDRAMGQVDDTLRHTITKLAHIHFPATRQSAVRIARLGEDRSRIHQVGSPGIDGIVESAGTLDPRLKPKQFALIALHPVQADEAMEYAQADAVVRALQANNFEKTVIIYPNNDPGCRGIIQRWRALKGDARFIIHRDLPRADFLALLRDAAILVGNSSAGIIEAGSFPTPVVDIGLRQHGRQRGAGVIHSDTDTASITNAIGKALRQRANSRRASNIYGNGKTGAKIARVLETVDLSPEFYRKIITY